MKKEFEDYFKSIELSSTMRETIRNKYKTLTTSANVEEFDDIFISEGISSESIREYFSVCGFTSRMLCMIEISTKRILIWRIHKSISAVFIDDYNFDLKSSSDNSKLNCSIRRSDAHDVIVFNSSGKNCSKLLEIIKKHFLSNLNY